MNEITTGKGIVRTLIKDVLRLIGGGRMAYRSLALEPIESRKKGWASFIQAGFSYLTKGPYFILAR